MFRYIMFAGLLALTSCMEGPEGPTGSQGPRGPEGSGAANVVVTGVLYSSDLTPSTTGGSGYWDIDNSNLSESALVAVYVRDGSGFMWQPPSWYLSTTYIRIHNQTPAKAGSEYKLVIAK